MVQVRMTKRKEKKGKEKKKHKTRKRKKVRGGEEMIEKEMYGKSSPVQVQPRCNASEMDGRMDGQKVGR